MAKRMFKGLLNKYVHTYYEEPLKFFPKFKTVQKQGKIISVVACNEWGLPIQYEVQWYDMGFGYPNVSEIVPLQKMLDEGWGYYDDDEIWRSECDKTFEVLKLNNERINKTTKGDK